MNKITSAHYGAGATLLFVFATFFATHNIGVAIMVGVGVMLSLGAIGLAIDESLEARK